MFKAELSSLPAQTKLIPFGCKAELSSLPAQTKLIPVWVQSNHYNQKALLLFSYDSIKHLRRLVYLFLTNQSDSITSDVIGM
jgi:hypothetical protein